MPTWPVAPVVCVHVSGHIPPLLYHALQAKVVCCRELLQPDVSTVLEQSKPSRHLNAANYFAFKLQCNKSVAGLP